jgi:hypothetical protein
MSLWPVISLHGSSAGNSTPVLRSSRSVQGAACVAWPQRLVVDRHAEGKSVCTRKSRTNQPMEERTQPITEADGGRPHRSVKFHRPNPGARCDELL